MSDGVQHVAAGTRGDGSNGRSSPSEPVVMLNPDPRTISEAELLECQALPAAAANALGALARLDHAVTAEEYEALCRAGETLARFSDHDTLVRALVVRSALDGDSFADALRRVRESCTGVATDQRMGVFLAGLPLLHCQGAQARPLASDWAKALGLRPKDLVEAIDGLPAGDDDSVVRRLLKVRRSDAATDELREVRALASTLRDEALAGSLKEIESRWPEPWARSRLRTELANLEARLEERVDVLVPSPDQLSRQRELGLKLVRVASALGDLVVQRLALVEERLSLEREDLLEDVESFVEAAVAEIEIEMRDLVDDEPDWTNPKHWEKFAKSVAAERLRSRYARLQRRYDRTFEQWRKEQERFSKELLGTVESLFDVIPPETFASLVKTEQPSAHMQEAADRASDLLLKVTGGTLGAGAVGSVALLTTGVVNAATLAQVGSAAVGLASNPVGWAILGTGAVTVATAYIWRKRSDTKSRKRAVVKEKAASLRAGLLGLLGDPAEDFDKLASDVLQGFHEAAQRHYAPLICDARRAVLLADAEVALIEQVRRDTRRVYQEALRGRVSPQA